MPRDTHPLWPVLTLVKQEVTRLLRIAHGTLVACQEPGKGEKKTFSKVRNVLLVIDDEHRRTC